jgi:uridine kinase
MRIDASISFVIGIAGGSCSGKTTLARAVGHRLGPAPVALLAQDAYYRDRSDVPPDLRDDLDYDAPEAFDHALLVEHLAALRRGATVTPPRYCYVTHCRLGPGAPLAAAGVVIAEGLLLLHDAAVRDALDFRIFVDAPEPVRLARRTARDVGERGRTPEAVLAQCRRTVLPAHARYVEPSRVWADLIVLNLGDVDVVADVAARAIQSRLGTWRQAAGMAA